MDRQVDFPSNPLEQAGYLEFCGAHIYAVLHGVRDPAARVLLAGPFASERFFSYVPWVRWARYLAARQIEVLRFDYRGVGESTGNFEDLSFGNWQQDASFLAGWLKDRAPDVPLILHGFELGALLSGNTFADGVGDALLMWSAPANANEVLRRPLSRKVFKSVFGRKPLAEYVQELETGQTVEVEGYQWSGRLWKDSFALAMPVARGDDGSATHSGKPARFVTLDRPPASLLKGTAMGYAVSVNLDLSELFADSYQWIAQVLAARAGRTN